MHKLNCLIIKYFLCKCMKVFFVWSSRNLLQNNLKCRKRIKIEIRGSLLEIFLKNSLYKIRLKLKMLWINIRSSCNIFKFSINLNNFLSQTFAKNWRHFLVSFHGIPLIHTYIYIGKYLPQKIARNLHRLKCLNLYSINFKTFSRLVFVTHIAVIKLNCTISAYEL